MAYKEHLHVIHTLCLNKNAPNLAGCNSYDKYCLILIFFGKRHQHTNSKVMCMFNFPRLYTFCFLYLLLKSSDVNDAKRNVFSSVNC